MVAADKAEATELWVQEDQEKTLLQEAELLLLEAEACQLEARLLLQVEVLVLEAMETRWAHLLVLLLLLQLLEQLHLLIPAFARHKPRRCDSLSSFTISTRAIVRFIKVDIGC